MTLDIAKPKQLRKRTADEFFKIIDFLTYEVGNVNILEYDYEEKNWDVWAGGDLDGEGRVITRWMTLSVNQGSSGISYAINKSSYAPISCPSAEDPTRRNVVGVCIVANKSYDKKALVISRADRNLNSLLNRLVPVHQIGKIGSFRLRDAK